MDRFAVVAALPGVPEAARRVGAALDRLADRRALRLDPGQVRTELTLRGARAAALLAGADADLAALRAGHIDEVPGADAVRAAMRVYAELEPLAGVWRHAPRQALARLHALTAAEALDPDDLGRPASAQAAARIDVLCAALAEKTAAPAVVVAAIVHAEVLDSAAFGDAGGPIARAAARLVLLDRGADPHGVLALEIGHAALGLTEYQKCLGAYGNGGADGLAAWVRHCASALEVTATEVSQVAMVVRPGVRSSAYGRPAES
ncbi:MAG: oxidoreductase [Sporichthyaceae bacterium]